MLIAWLNDFKSKDYIGGAELSNYYWQRQGERLGLEIIEVSPGDEIPKADYYVLANCTRFNQDDLIKLPAYSIITAGLPHLSPEIYKKAKSACFMAPNHLKKYEDLNARGFYSAPYIDWRNFYPISTDERPDTNVYIGWILEHKGILNIVDYTKRMGCKVDFYGKGDEDLINRLKGLGMNVYPELNNLQLNEVYNRYSRFVWILGRYGSYGRTLVEAMLCKQKLIVDSKNFGLFSYRWDFTSRQAIIEALEDEIATFWQKLLA